MVYQEVLRNKNLDPESKAIYAYLASFTGDSNTCYPSRKLMLSELQMSETRFSKYMKPLLALGVVKIEREKNGNIYGKNTYTLTHKVSIAENEDFPRSENWSAEEWSAKNRSAENLSTNNNSYNNNSINNNNINNNRGKEVTCQQIADLYNDTCVSFPKVTKLSEARKKAIKARLKKYSLEDFQKAFRIAESSSFLKGGNGRNWSATFDWMINDSNMAKILDGNYSDKKETGKDEDIPEKVVTEEMKQKIREMVGSMGEKQKPDSDRKKGEDVGFVWQ